MLFLKILHKGDHIISLLEWNKLLSALLYTPARPIFSVIFFVFILLRNFSVGDFFLNQEAEAQYIGLFFLSRPWLYPLIV